MIKSPHTMQMLPFVHYSRKATSYSKIKRNRAPSLSRNHYPYNEDIDRDELFQRNSRNLSFKCNVQ